MGRTADSWCHAASLSALGHSGRSGFFQKRERQLWPRRRRFCAPEICRGFARNHTPFGHLRTQGRRRVCDCVEARRSRNDCVHSRPPRFGIAGCDGPNCPEFSVLLRQAVRQADAALYAVKRAGRNRVESHRIRRRNIPSSSGVYSHSGHRS